MESDAVRPVIAGAGQVLQRVSDPAEAREPLQLMLDALEAAGRDAATPELLARADSIRVAKGLWGYSNPGGLLRERLGAAPDAQTALGPISGATIQTMISHAAREIAAGEREVVLVTGAETQHSGRRAKAAGVDVRHSVQTDARPDFRFPHGEAFDHRAVGLGLGPPTVLYSVCENALRHARGESLEAHRVRISELWSGFSAVAASNPHAWLRKARTALEIRTPSADNRMIAYPYTKLLVANMVVDQGAAVIVCSDRAARRAGVPEDRLVYLHAGTQGTYPHTVLGQPDFAAQPAMAIAGRRALELAERSIDEIDHLDVYSCFPSAVQLAASELGFALERAPTVTGGLTFAGGPFNSYVLHATATMIEVLRADPGSRGLVTSLGGLLGKHAYGVYSTEPPGAGFRFDDVSAQYDALPTLDLAEDYTGPATVETYALHYEGGEPARAIAACRTPDARRVWKTSTDPALLDAMPREELCGTAVRITGGGFAA